MKGDPVLLPNHEDFDPDARPGDTYFKAHISEDPELDDVWGLIEKGTRNKISIYGVRTNASPECKLHPGQRVSPCVTKGIRLWSFSLVGNNAINTASYIKIAKSFSENVCDAFQQKTAALIKAAFPDVDMAPIPDQDGQDAGTVADGGATAVIADVVMKSELDPVVQDVAVIKGEMEGVKSGISSILDLLKKSDDAPANEDKKTDATSNDYITKATLEPVLDLIVKAKVDAQVSEIKKAYDAKIADLEKKIEEFGGETIRKGGRAVVLDMDGHSLGEVDNSFLSNLNALEG